MKKLFIGIYLIVQLAVLILIPLGFLLRKSVYLYAASPLALIAILFIAVYLTKTRNKKG